MKEQVNIPYFRYKDSEGHPTCAVDFASQQVCSFYTTKSFGTKEVCDHTLLTLDRRDDEIKGERMGSLIPCKGCLFWKKEEIT